MANPQQLKVAEDMARTQAIRKQAYRDWATSLSYQDLIEHLTDRRDNSLNLAGEEMENMDKKALYLQDAHAYGKVITYISALID